jgi:hypothetical protein
LCLTVGEENENTKDKWKEDFCGVHGGTNSCFIVSNLERRTQSCKISSFDFRITIFYIECSANRELNHCGIG